MRKVVMCALALGSFVVCAQAADLSLSDISGGSKDAPDWAPKVTVYGTIDLGFGYESNGLANSAFQSSAQQVNLLGASKALGNHAALTNNDLQHSTIGANIEENIGGGFVAIGRVSTFINPLYGELTDSCKGLVNLGNAIKNNTTLTAAGPGSACGQAFSSEAFGGVSSPVYGTLTAGRQNSLELNNLFSYDPMGGSYALSLVGWAGGAAGGMGTTEASRWDDSLKYTYTYGPVHASVMYADGAQDTAMHGNSYAGGAGFTWHGVSVDAVYTHEGAAASALLGLFTGTNVNQLYYFMTNNDAWAVQGKYVWDLGGGGFKDGACGLKDACDGAKLTFYAGYVHMDQTDAGTALGASAGTTIGGYLLAVNSIKLLSTRTLETEWVGGKYETGPWSFTAAYYHFSQDGFSEANFSLHISGGCAVNAYACAGAENQVSGLLDYAFNKYVDVYAGATYETLSGGFTHSSLNNAAYFATNNTTVISGLRVTF
jgi:hypothetical protein